MMRVETREGGRGEEGMGKGKEKGNGRGEREREEDVKKEGEMW